MALAAQAALLDELMGRSRNNLSHSENIKWYSDEVCKNFLAGFCPNDMFINTKNDMGPCELIHDNKILEEYKNSKDFKKMGYERSLYRLLEGMINENDRRVSTNRRRLIQNGSTVVGGIVVERKKKIDELNKKIISLLKEVEELGNKGKILESQNKMSQCEELQREMTFFENDIKLHMDNAKEMEVCDICGAMQVKNDIEIRVKEHESGRMHAGFLKVREMCHKLHNDAITSESILNKYIDHYEKNRDRHRSLDKHSNRKSDKRSRHRSRSHNKYSRKRR